MINCFKRFLFGYEVKLSETDATLIAQTACINDGCLWLEPVNSKLFRGVYSFWTNFGSKGNNYLIKINASNGQIISKGITSR